MRAVEQLFIPQHIRIGINCASAVSGLVDLTKFNGAKETGQMKSSFLVLRRLLGIGLLLLPAMLITRVANAATANTEYCKPVKDKCINVVDYGNGIYWVANRVVKEDKVTWEPIKRANCPSKTEPHYRESAAYDSTFGAYTCLYDDVLQPPPAATSGGKVGRYIKTHKFLLVSDAILVGSSLADAVTTERCLHVTGCVESNPFVGPHPSDLEIYGIKMGLTGVFVTMNHKWFHDSQHRSIQFLPFLWTAPLVATSIAAAENNVRVTDNLSKARAQLMSQVPVR
jgi:hypothetical protein